MNLIYFGKRYYDPELARWLTTDPAGFVDSLNLYQYALNNPYSYYDPDGEFIFAVCIPFAALLTPTVLKICAEAIAVGIGCWGAYQGTKYAAEAVGSPYTLSEDGCYDLLSIWKNTDIYAPDRPLPKGKCTNSGANFKNLDQIMSYC